MKEHKEEMQASSSTTKRPWKKMELSYLGNAVELIQGGVGKLTPVGADPGDTRKTPSSG